MQIKNNILILGTELTKFTVPQIWGKITGGKLQNFNAIDLTSLEKTDSSGIAFLDEIQSKYDVKLTNIPSKFTEAFATFSSQKIEIEKPKSRFSFFESLGDKTFSGLNSFASGIILSADIAYWSLIGLVNKRGQRKGSVVQQSLLIGADAVGIIGLLSLIIGLILALQAAAQLRQFGANIFVADLIAVSMVREMGPMMTAIIVAGRSGSAIASEIATMKVTEEIDALKMMAINPIRYIVVPKLHAITLCMPLLVSLSMLVGIFGGLIVAVTYLDLSVTSYVNEVLAVLKVKDVLVGLSKSVVFSWVIVGIGGYYGFNVQGGAEGVGKATTKSVVASIFAVIILDAVFSLIYLGKV
jgi:phospholipid/cholesterol/gamma-HCH transport system permease protein